MSELRANTISDAAGTGPVTLTGQSAAKAWARFDVTGTVALNQSANVSSLTDHAVGQYSLTLTNDMAYSTYGFSCASSGNSTSFSRTGGAGMSGNRSSTASSFAVDTGFDGSSTTKGGFLDRSNVGGTVWGDLA